MPQRTERGTYLRIAESVRQDIASGRITSKLPPKSELEKEHGVAHGVIDRAIAHLKKEGVIETVPGRGAYVAGSVDLRPLEERLRELLRSGGYKVGDEFPTENALVEQFDSSKMTLRPALAKLEAQGFLGWGPTRRRVVLAIPPS